MLYRILFSFLLALSLSSQASACSCSSWSGYVSDFTENYISVWGVPTAATLETKWNKDLSYAMQGVTYKLEILEGFDRIIQTNINVGSSVPNGANCGVGLEIGVPQFINAYKGTEDNYGISTCTPSLPYDAVKLYFETGKDAYIPEWGKCYSWPEDSTDFTPPIFNEEREECSVWEGIYYGSPSPDLEAKDLEKYRKIWRNKIKSQAP